MRALATSAPRPGGDEVLDQLIEVQPPRLHLVQAVQEHDRLPLGQGGVEEGLDARQFLAPGGVVAGQVGLQTDLLPLERLGVGIER